MSRFKDALGREWSLELTVLDVRALRKEFELDLLDVLNPTAKIMERLATDTILLVDVLSVLLQDQIQTLGLNEKQVALGFVGEGINSATDALVEAIANFSKPQEGRMIRAMWEKIQATRDLAVETVMDRMGALDLNKLVTERIDDALSVIPKKSGS